MTPEELLNLPNSLPSAPKVVEELIGSFENADVSVEEIVRKLSADPVLSAKLLRLANSAYYHASRRIGTVQDAVQMLGFVTVRTLVISAGLVSAFKTVPRIDLRQFWRYSLNTAAGARWIATRAGQSGELAFTIGMMHAIGQLMIHAGLPAQAAELGLLAGPYHCQRLVQEQVALGFNFADVGAELAVRWKFPDTFAAAIRAFPDGAPRLPMAAVIHLAAWRARANENGGGEPGVDPFPAAAAQALGLAPAAMLMEMPGLGELSAGLEELLR
ncbi:MAG: histidine kinase [Betaproteobacteria bacterium]|nr:histidine kinase [Betaproteobacteria bacterium]